MSNRTKWDEDPDYENAIGGLCSDIRAELWNIYLQGELSFEVVISEITSAAHVSHNEINVCRELILRNNAARSRGFVNPNREEFSELLFDYLQTCLDYFGYGSL